MTIDSHCHLSATDYDLPLNQIIQDAQKGGVNKILGVACEAKDWPELLDLIQKEESVYGAIALHPEYADYDYQADLDKLESLFQQNPKLIAVGEMGLDYHEAPQTIDNQKQLFQKQLEIAHKLNKPVMIHTRDAEEDTIRILKEAHQKGWLKNSGVVHCFTGSLNLAKAVLDLGLYISASGVITFKKADELRNVFEQIPLDRLLVETDAPWLAPTPYRGKQNQPLYVQKTLEKLAEIKQVSVEQMEKITDENFNRLYLTGDK